ncbi:MAG TPA: phage holin family protein [Candidatus Limnocylindria bacterium]|nr:phage holin family protein [Candidatus Limnocylindria bacterium]
MAAPREERSLGEMFSELSQQTSTLVKKEVELARHEVTRSVTALGRHAAFIAVGGVLAYAGFIVLLLGIGWALAEAGLPLWAALLLVGLVVVVVGAGLAFWALGRLRQTSVVPDKTVRTVQDNVRWAKEQTQ